MRSMLGLLFCMTVFASSAYTLDDKKLIDMTYPFAEDTLHWPTAKPFHLEKTNEGRTTAGYWYSAYDYSGSELENHDEQRAATAFSFHRERAAALAMATVPGARLFHQGQFAGRRARIPVFLGRRPAEPINQPLADFYKTLLRVINASVFREGEWSLCHCTRCRDNSTYQNLLSWSWEQGQRSLSCCHQLQ